MFALVFPQIDPIAIELGPVVIRWYALAYLAGLLLGWKYMARLAPQGHYPIKPVQVDDFLIWATLGVVIGGRLGYVLFYKPSYYFANPLEIPMVMHGGMAFHGGFLGVVVAGLLFCAKHKIHPGSLGDLLALAAPIGLFFGRIANFVNGELFGRVAPDAPLAMVFPHGGPEPRHPSQLYEAALEGLVLFILLAILWRMPAFRARPGALIGIFVAGYGLSRFVVEFFREPDYFLGFVALDWLTMGQMLSLPMILVGLGLTAYIWRKGPQPPAKPDAHKPDAP